MRSTKAVAVVVAALLAFASLPAAAGAHEVTGSPVAQQLLWRNWSWWQANGKTPCYPPFARVYVADFVSGLGYTPIGSCDITIERNTWNDAQGWPIDGYLYEMRLTLYRVFNHEMGHSAGLYHLRNGWVMDDRGLCCMAIPGDARAWARGE